MWSKVNLRETNFDSSYQEARKIKIPLLTEQNAKIRHNCDYVAGVLEEKLYKQIFITVDTEHILICTSDLYRLYII